MGVAAADGAGVVAAGVVGVEAAAAGLAPKVGTNGLAVALSLLGSLEVVVEEVVEAAEEEEEAAEVVEEEVVAG